MTAWGVVAACAIGGGVAGPLLDWMGRRVPTRPRSQPVVAPVAEVAAVAVGSPSPALRPGAPSSALADPGSVADLGTLADPGVPSPARLRQQVAAGLVTAALFALAAARVGAVAPLAAFCALAAGLVAVSITDLRTGLVPRRLLYPAALVVACALFAASAADGTWRPMLDGLVGGSIAFFVFAAIWWIYPRGLGFGDVRLAGLCGLALGYLGFRQLYIGFLAAFVFGAVAGLAVLAVRGRKRFPFAPALAAGTMFGVLWGGWLGNLWLHPAG